MNRNRLIYLVKVVSVTTFLVLLVLVYFLLKPFFYSSTNVSDFYVQQDASGIPYLCILESNKTKTEQEGQVFEQENFKLNQVRMTDGELLFSKYLGTGQFIYHTSKTLWFIGTEVGIKVVNALSGEEVSNSKFLTAKNNHFAEWKIIYLEEDSILLQTIKGNKIAFHESQFSYDSKVKNKIIPTDSTNIDKSIILQYTESNNAQIRSDKGLFDNTFRKPIVLKDYQLNLPISIKGNCFVIHKTQNDFVLSAVYNKKINWTKEINTYYKEGMQIQSVVHQRLLYILIWSRTQKNILCIDTETGEIKWDTTL